jgi:DNA-binding GntR family transcriptional regulator
MPSATNQSSGKNSIRRQPLAVEVFDLLYQRIITGEYKSGDWLRQERISEELNVSHIPVREALTRLESAGLLERIPYRGMRVPIYQQEQIIDAYTVRLLFDIVVARLAANNIDGHGITELRGILEDTKEMASQEDLARHRQSNKRLHIAIAKGTRSPLLAELYQLISNRFPDWLLYERLIKQGASLPSILDREFEEHRALVDAIASHDPELAEQKAMEHLDSIGREMENMLGLQGQILSTAKRQADNSINFKSLALKTPRGSVRKS